MEIETSKNRLMNSKAEWNHASIPRIVIEEGEKQVEDRESGKSRAEPWSGERSGRRLI